MAFTPLERQKIDDATMLFLAAKRPPEEIRDKLDLKVTVEKQSVIVYEVRPHYQDPSIILDLAKAKTTYVASRKIWNVFWIKCDLKWHAYKPEPTVKTIDEFFDLVSEDKYCCFFG
jgi:hypothetical protein